MSDLKSKTQIEVEGVKLTVTQTGNSVSVHRVVGRDRKLKLDITSGRVFAIDNDLDLAAIALVKKMKCVAALQTARCTCDYRYGFSDHADHCQSIYVARYDGGHGYD